MTIVGKDGTYPLSINRRIAEVLAVSSVLGFQVFGDATTVSANTITNVFDSNGIYNRLQTGAVTNESARVSGGLLYNRQKEPSFYCKFKLGSSSNVRFFAGLTDVAADLPLVNPAFNGNYAGLYGNVSIDSNFRSIRSSGGAVTTASLGNSLDTSYHELYMWLKKSGGGNSMIIQLDGDDRVEYTTSLPSITAQLRYVVGVANVSNISKNIEIAKISINTEV